jgi:Zn finger protein HypA/HybF involved in hydrogenase expression
MNLFEPASDESIQSSLDIKNEKTMKKLTFYCLSCRRDTDLARPPVKCEHCGSENGLIFRWRGRSWRAAAGSESSPVPAQ